MFLSIRGFFLRGLGLFGWSWGSGALAGCLTHRGPQPAGFKGSSTLATFPCWHEGENPQIPPLKVVRGESGAALKEPKGPVATLQWGGDP